ncbi:DedA family protein [Campylobacter sp. JMF_04 NA10]|uniref:DedA family protein n=1 Tax=Campylobacter sp. JMF_04 NA10 TaxID=2983824 RepID=UPI0022EA0E75|nr:DedA family protein [Campylobacter sp. JMF_04 NA10]MDA3075793.1 DedA family protein [Campylobacter sp. JMF_04 NA10]
MDSMFENLHTWGYLLLFLYTLGGGFIALVAAGILSFTGELNIWVCIAVACVSNFLGDTGLFWVSRYNKKDIMPYLKKQRRNLALSQILFKRYGDRIILIQKFIYGLKTLVPIAIGITKYSFLKFSILNAVSSLVWALIIGLLSFYAGDFVQEIYSHIKEKPYIAPLILALVVAAIICYFKFATKKRIKGE